MRDGEEVEGTLGEAKGRSVSARAVDIGTAFVWVTLGTIICGAALQIDVRSGFDPGARFFPLMAGIAIIALGLAQCLVSFVSEQDETIELPTLIAAEQMSLVAAATVGFIVLSEVLGFSASVFLFFFVVLLFVERKGVTQTLLVSASAAFVMWVVFGLALHMELPTGLLSYKALRLQ